MPTDVFWTGLFTFGGGLVGALGTYVGARSQHALRLRELELERVRHESDESQKARQDENEAREQRRSLYLGYLAALDGVVHATATGDLDRDGMARKWAEFVGADDELELGGTADVMDATYPLYNVARKIFNEYTRVIERPGEQWPKDALLRLDAHRPEYNHARAELVSAMRVDLHRQGAEMRQELPDQGRGAAGVAG